MNQHYQLYIDGKFVDAQDSTYISVINPASGKKIAQVPNATQEEVNLAVKAAKTAQKSWAQKPAIERAKYLYQISAKIREHREHLAKTITAEQGKIAALALVEVDFTADYIDYMAEWARRIEGEVITSDRAGESIFLLRKSVGVVAGILPWNFPFFLIARKMAPALVTGNTVVIKPSEETPLNAFEFAKLVDQTDLPKGVFNLISGYGSSVGSNLTSNPDVNLISFTGSVPTGSAIMQAAGVNLTRVNLELGGKAPAIVLADADLDLAAKAIFDSRIINTGQVCNCAERVYVERAVADEFLSKVQQLMSQVKIGDPSVDNTVEMGPLINEAAAQKVNKMVETAVKQGARLVCGGQKISELGVNFYQPTLLSDCDESMDIMRQEIFGPVLPIQIVGSLKEAIDYANRSEYGLTSSIYTRDLSKAMQACNALEFGETYVNRENFEAMQGFHAGRRKSGIGGADGKHGLYEYMETQVIYIDHGVLK